jgi:putative endonuclease
MASHNQLGQEGELLAAEWLRQNNFVLLHRNWRHGRYEVDIIASRGDVLHFIEVKTRRSTRFGEPEESVGRSKIGHLLKAGAAYQYEYPRWKRVQYDVLAITLVPGEEGEDRECVFIEDIYL